MILSRRANLAVAAAFIGLIGQGATVDANADNLPKQLVWTTYGTGATAYNHAVAIGSALKNQMGIDLRLLPGKNDISRLIPLRKGAAAFSLTGIGSTYMAQEGVFTYANRKWGPQKIRMMATSLGSSNISIVAAGDVGVKSLSDIAGKRVAWIAGSPTNNENIRAILTFANLTWDDVEKVEFGGYKDAVNGIINNQADVVYAPTTSGMMYQLEASPRGIFWPEMPHDDERGWSRLHEAAPYFVPNTATLGAGITKDAPHEGATYPYPMLVAYDQQDADMVYNLTKVMFDLYPNYTGKTPGVEGWALERQSLSWAVPYHVGAVRYFREVGEWSDEHQTHNEKLVERQNVLSAAWDEFVIKSADLSDEDFTKGWTGHRFLALTKAGMDPVYGR